MKNKGKRGRIFKKGDNFKFDKDRLTFCTKKSGKRFKPTNSKNKFKETISLIISDIKKDINKVKDMFKTLYKYPIFFVTLIFILLFGSIILIQTIINKDIQDINNSLDSIKQELESIEQTYTTQEEFNTYMNNITTQLDTTNKNIKEVESKVSKVQTKKETTVTSRGSTTSRTSTSTSSEGYVAFTATAYCPCAKCCGKTNGITASGTKATAGRTVAMNSSYKFGTKIEIKGLGTYIVEDRGGAIQGNKIDIFFNTHQEALNFGRKTVYLKVVK